MRTIFAAGVLDAFLKAGSNPFDCYFGVYAGAGAIAGFLANMPARTHNILTDYSQRPEFVSIRRFLRGGHFMDLVNPTRFNGHLKQGTIVPEVLNEKAKQLQQAIQT